jgi:hypothetical protein
LRLNGVFYLQMCPIFLAHEFCMAKNMKIVALHLSAGAYVNVVQQMLVCKKSAKKRAKVFGAR